MSYEEAAMNALIQGVRDGRKETLEDAPYVRESLGIEPDANTMKYMPIEIGPLPAGVLGVTHITPAGRAVGMRISPYIAKVGIYLAEKYKKSKDWMRDFIQYYACDVTNHEGHHVLTAPALKGEEITDENRAIAEIYTTYHRRDIKKRRGQPQRAKFIEETNPYPVSWKIGQVADWAPYEGLSGRGAKGFLADNFREPMYKTRARLAWQATKAGFRKLGNYLGGSGVPSYVPARA